MMEHWFSQQRIVLPHKITQQITGTYTEPGAPSSSSFGECHTGCWFLPLMTLSLGKGKCLTVCSSSSSFLLLSTSKIHLITPKHKQGLWVATSKGRKEEWFTVSLFPNERWHKPWVLPRETSEIIKNLIVSSSLVKKVLPTCYFLPRQSYWKQCSYL